MKPICKYLAGLLLVMGSILSTYAQDDWNPENPADPQMNYKVRTSVVPQAASAWISVWDDNGDGYYRYGERIYLSCPSINGAYKFSHWTLDGEEYSTESYTAYTMGNASVRFAAHYEFVPDDPSDPSYTPKNRLYLVAEPLTACTFSQNSGQKWNYDEWVYLGAEPTNSGFKFLGWYLNGTLYSQSQYFNYQMPDAEVTLTARFEYSPDNPGDPFGDGSQTDIENTPSGDANGDGVVNVTDAVYLINVCLGLTEGANEKNCDVNGDGAVNVTDAVAIINMCLKINK